MKKLGRILLLIVSVTVANLSYAEIKIKLYEFPRWAVGKSTDKFSWIKEKMAEFEKQNPGVKIELTQLSWGGGEDKRQIAIAAGEFPDVSAFSLFVLLKPISQGMVEPVDNYFTKSDIEDYYPSAIESFRYQGKTWAFPWLTTGVMLFINLDLFKERGVEPPKNGRWTYEEFVQKMKQLTFDRNGDNKPDVFGFATTVQAGSSDYLPFLYMDGGKPLDDTGQKYVFNSPDGVSGLQKLVDLSVKEKVMLPGCVSMTPGDVWQAFAKEQRVACAAWGTWAIKALQDTKKAAGFKFALAYYPTGKTGKPVTFIGSNGFAVFKQKEPKKKELCMKLAKFLTDGQNQKALREYASFPTRKSSGNVYYDDVYMSMAAKILQNGIITPVHLEWSKIDDRIYRQVQLAVLGEVGAKDSLDIPAREIQRIIDRAK